MSGPSNGVSKKSLQQLLDELPPPGDNKYEEPDVCLPLKSR